MISQEVTETTLKDKKYTKNISTKRPHGHPYSMNFLRIVLLRTNFQNLLLTIVTILANV